MAVQQLTAPRDDRTSEIAIARADRDRRDGPGLWVPLSELCGDALIEAYRRMAEAYYARRDAA